jgi:nitrite reductase (cytochrome c-552)
MTDSAEPSKHPSERSGWLPLLAVIAVTAIVSAGLASLLINIFTRKQEAKDPYLKLVNVDENTTDPAVWGMNWPRQFDQYQRTVDTTHTRYGGSEGEIPKSRLEKDPWLKRMFAGYPFALDFRERRGHAYMLYDQEQTLRITERPQTGACLHCHSSVVATWRRLGLESVGKRLEDAVGFDWPAVNRGFELIGKMSYIDAHAALVGTPDAPGRTPLVPGAPRPGATTREAIEAHVGAAHPVSCVDCHDPRTMELRISRPGFVQGIAALAASEASIPHLPSVQRWRNGTRAKPYDPNADATRQEMRSFVCAQCHVEYYCGPKTTLFFPWSHGLKVEEIEAAYETTTFPAGEKFYDWKHAETGAPLFKAQHPEFELWSQGVHARSGVSCADCHMPYTRDGAMKVSDHWVRSPLLNVNRACQVCHHFSEEELLARVAVIQDRNSALMSQAGAALVDMLDAIQGARQRGVSDEALGPALALQRKAQWRLDFVNAENSMGFHAPQEAARILGEAIDLARQGQVAALQAQSGAPGR